MDTEAGFVTTPWMQGLVNLERLRSIARGIAGLEASARQERAALVEIRRRQIYQLLAELRRRERDAVGHPVDLRTAELQVFSQNGEDGILHALVKALEDVPRYFVEFGVQDGTECNTRLLAEVYGWTGLYVEPCAESHEALTRRYRGVGRVATLQDSVTPANVNDLFRRLGVPGRFGVLSIDVDGQDYWIWKALDTSFRPDIVVIEYNADWGTERSVVEAAGLPFQDVRMDSSGASIAALTKLANDRGYRLVHCDLAGVNAFFVADDHPRLRSIEIIGIVDRSANYYLAGRGHPSSPARPTVDPDT